MATTTVINANNVHLPIADVAQGTDFFYPNSTGAAIASTVESWKLTVDKTGLPAGVKYLTVAVQYQYSTGWRDDVSNAPDGWFGGANRLDGGGTNFLDFMASIVGSVGPDGNLIGERPTHVRLHILFSNGSTVKNVNVQTAPDFSLS